MAPGRSVRSREPDLPLIRDRDALLAAIARRAHPRYLTAEHFMMAEKARLFGDEDALRRILAAREPGAAKRYGREVCGFDETRWAEARVDIVVRGNLAKFGRHPSLAHFLLATGDRVLVEASPLDRVWGIGLAEDDPRAAEPALWPGLNLLGFALMEVRRRLGEESERSSGSL